MPESETVTVFRILAILAKAPDPNHALAIDDIADEAHLGRRQTERVMTVLKQAGAVRAGEAPMLASSYFLTAYGRQRLGMTAG